MSNANPSLLVPSGIAFSIWLPIFVCCITYGVVQARSEYRHDSVFEKIGWWTAAGFAGVCAWGLVNAFWPMASVQMATATVFIPTMLILVTAMFKFIEARKRSPNGYFISFTGISLIAGWCSIAVFLNWTPQTVAWLSAYGFSAANVSAAMLMAALIWISFIAIKSGGNTAYIIPPVWGAAWLIMKRMKTEPLHWNIIIIASVGIALLVLIAVMKWRQLPPR